MFVGVSYGWELSWTALSVEVYAFTVHCLFLFLLLLQCTVEYTCNDHLLWCSIIETRLWWSVLYSCVHIDCSVFYLCCWKIQCDVCEFALLWKRLVASTVYVCALIAVSIVLFVLIITIIGRFYIALFSALEQTHCVFQHTCGWFMCWLVCVTLNVRFQYPLVRGLCMTWVLLQWHRLCIHFICPQVNGLSVFWTVFAEHIFLSFFSA